VTSGSPGAGALGGEIPMPPLDALQFRACGTKAGWRRRIRFNAEWIREQAI